MEQLKRMAVFFHVVDAGSFSAAARRLGMAKSAVSRHVARLEEETGVRLMTRTTRRLSLTEAGEVYYQACARIVQDAAEATRQLGGVSEQLSGSLRISCPVALGSDHIVPLVKDFADQYPHLRIELLVDDHVVNMVGEGIDVAIRVGWLADSSLIARKVADSPRLLCASPDYLDRHGVPTSPDELASQEWVIFTLLPTPYRQTLSKNGQQQVVRVNGRFKTNNALAMRSLLLAGAGMGVLSQFLVSEDIARGRLVPVMPDYDTGSAGVYAVYPDRHYKLARVQVFIEYLARHLKFEEVRAA